MACSAARALPLLPCPPWGGGAAPASPASRRRGRGEPVPLLAYAPEEVAVWGTVLRELRGLYPQHASQARGDELSHREALQVLVLAEG